MSSLALKLLGPPGAVLDGRRLPLANRKGVALLAYLAATAQAHPRDNLAALLWPEAPQARARASLRQTVWALRQAGLDDWLDLEEDQVALKPGYVLDVADFRQNAARASAHRHDTHQPCADCLGWLAAAVGQYQGDFLAGLALADSPVFEAWQREQAEGLRQTLGTALERLSGHYALSRDWDRAIETARRWVALDPLHEPAQRALIDLYARSGQRRLAVQQFESLRHALADELGVGPEPASQRLFAELAVGRLDPEPNAGYTAAITFARRRHNLPAALTSFVGREKEIADTRRLLSVSRLVTLTGSGGCGKTRLSIQVGFELLDANVDGVWLVELDAVSDGARVPQTVIAALGLQAEAGQSELQVLIAFLRDKDLVLIVDNCEHLIEAAAHLAQALLQACPRVKCLASSREALRVAGEVLYRVPPLEVLDTNSILSPEAMIRVPALRLFIERAMAVQPDLTFGVEDLAAVAEICRRLDGIPLALELAAARVSVLTVNQIATNLEDRFEVLNSSSRTVPQRQQTLWALIDWSYQLLLPAERKFFRRLGVFVGGWTLPAAEQVIVDELAMTNGTSNQWTDVSLGAYGVLNLHDQLVSKSLVQTRNVDGELRYGLLDTLRQYAQAKLVEAGELTAFQQRHLNYYRHLAEQAEPELKGPHQSHWVQRLRVEQGNVNAALACSLEMDVEAGLHLANAYYRFWLRFGSIAEGIGWFERLISQGNGHIAASPHALALALRSNLYIWYGDFAQATALAEAGLLEFRKLGDRRGEAMCLHRMAVISAFRGEPEAIQLAQASASLFRAEGDLCGLADVLSDLGGFIDNQDYARARAYLDQSLVLSREAGDWAEVAWQMLQAGRLAVWHGDYARARGLLEEALHLHRQMGIQAIDGPMSELGRLALLEGNLQQAQAFYEAGRAQAQAGGRPNAADWALAHLAYVSLRQGEYRRARVQFQESLLHFQARNNHVGVIYCVEGFASLLVSVSQFSPAISLFAWADAQRSLVTDSRPPFEQATVNHDLDLVRAQLDEHSIIVLERAGRGMSTNQVVQQAFATLQHGEASTR
jgi:predicted ATPase/DNA-binding SARP family transcriptional activator